MTYFEGCFSVTIYAQENIIVFVFYIITLSLADFFLLPCCGWCYFVIKVGIRVGSKETENLS